MIVDPLILIPCAKTSKNHRCKAREMYSPSVYFQKVWQYAQLMGDSIMILSSRYGLLHPDAEIDPYDEYLSTKAKAKKWASRVGPDLVRLIQFCNFTRVFFLTGQKYSHYLKEYLIDLVEDRALIVSDPMEGLGIGQRLQWLTENIKTDAVAITCECCGEETKLSSEDFQELMLSDAAIECDACCNSNDDYEEDYEVL